MLSEQITLISSYMMSKLYDEAKRLPRRRQNLNLHDSHKENCQRFSMLSTLIVIFDHIAINVIKKKELLIALKGHFL